MDPLTMMALLQGGTSLLSGILGRNAEKEANATNQANFEKYRSTDFKRLRADAIAGGFNPLTALQATGAAAYSTQPPLVAPVLSASNAVAQFGTSMVQGISDFSMQGLQFDHETSMQSAQFAHDFDMAALQAKQMASMGGSGFSGSSGTFWANSGSGPRPGTPGQGSDVSQVDPDMVGFTYQDALDYGLGPLGAEFIPAANMIVKGGKNLGAFLWNGDIIPGFNWNTILGSGAQQDVVEPDRMLDPMGN